MPFFAYTIAFLFLPAGSILLGAFEGKRSLTHYFSMTVVRDGGDHFLMVMTKR